jgi:hypothetical protein
MVPVVLLVLITVFSSVGPNAAIADPKPQAEQATRQAESCSGQIVVKSVPPGAAVQIGGRFEGNAPVAKTLKCGRHTLSARMSAHEAVRQSIVVRDGIEEITLALTPIPGAVRPAHVTTPDVAGPSPAAAPPGEGVAAVAPVPPALASTSAATGTLTVKTTGFEATSGAAAVATLGLLASHYAVEVDGKFVVAWSFRGTETTLQFLPGEYRLRVLVRNALLKVADPVHDTSIQIAPGQPTTVAVKFHLSAVEVNGIDHPFTLRSWQNERR